MNSIFGNESQNGCVDTKFESIITQFVKKSGDRMTSNLKLQGNNIAELGIITNRYITK